jgi:hypothetical protein
MASMTAGSVTHAQEPVVAAANPAALFTSPDPKLHANKQVVYKIILELDTSKNADLRR